MSLYIYELHKQNIITSVALIAYSTWFHVAVISGTNSFSLCVNGIPVGSSASTKTTSFQESNQQRLTLTVGNPEPGANSGNIHSLMCNTGKTRTQSNRSVIGVDDLRFYSRELKVKEVQALADDELMPTRYFFQ